MSKTARREENAVEHERGDWQRSLQEVSWRGGPTARWVALEANRECASV